MNKTLQGVQTQNLEFSQIPGTAGVDTETLNSGPAVTGTSPNTDFLQLDLGMESDKKSAEDDPEKEDEQSKSEEPKESSEDDNFMELYVAKELKDKIEPLEEVLEQRKAELEQL